MSENLRYVVKHKKLQEGIGIGNGWVMDRPFIPVSVVEVEEQAANSFSLNFTSPGGGASQGVSFNQLTESMYMASLLGNLNLFDLSEYVHDPGQFDFDINFTDNSRVYLVYLEPVKY